MKKSDQLYIWDSVLRSLETKPHYLDSIQGASGVEHPIYAIGIDENRKRAVVLSKEGNPRNAILAQKDIQEAFSDFNVILARPIAVNIAAFVDVIIHIFGQKIITFQEWGEKIESRKANPEEFKEAYKRKNGSSRVPVFNNFDDVQWLSVLEEAAHQASLVEVSGRTDDIENMSFDFSRLATYDPVAADRKVGIGSIPLYEYSPDETEVFKSGSNLDDVRQLLVERDVLQYFFPPQDHLALGMVDQNVIRPAEVTNQVRRAPSVGHPFGENEIISASTIEPLDLVDALEERGLFVEGELGVELTEEGQRVRSKVRFRPRESIFTRLAKVFSVKVNLSLPDFLGGG